jgi:AcrR family transcriptional regulator
MGIFTQKVNDAKIDKNRTRENLSRNLRDAKTAREMRRGNTVKNSAENRKKSTASRKRGDDLTAQIFTATLEIIRERGYSRATFTNIAFAANTGRSVLYHRWSTLLELAIDAYMWRARNDDNGGGLAKQVFDSGNLATDLKNLFNFFAHKAAAMVDTEFARIMLTEYANPTPRSRELAKMARETDLAAIDKILERAFARGEIARPIAEIPVAIKLLPFEFLRFRALSGLEKVSVKVIAELVDNVMMPALKNLK